MLRKLARFSLLSKILYGRSDIGLDRNHSIGKVRIALAKTSPVSRKDLASVIGYKNLDFDDRILEVAFSRLRQKIDSIYPDNNLIRAARSQGYLLAAHIELNK